MDLIKRKWYKNLGERKNHIGKFDGWHSLNIISVSEYIYEGELHGYSECFTGAYKFAKECPLSEIQQYLPDGHPDKEFVLPEKWCVEITASNVDVLSKWRGDEDLKDGKIYGYLHSDLLWRADIRKSTEITFEQFKKYVLKQEDMEEKEIIGYKLKEDCEQFREAALKLSKTVVNWENSTRPYDINITQESYIKRLKEAKVFDLWFEPIFKEKFKVGDAIIVLNPNDASACGLETNRLYYIIKIANNGQYGNSEYCSCSNTLNGSRVNQGDIKLSGIRLATPEEIKKTLVEEAVKRGFKGGIKIDKTPLNYDGYTMIWTLGSSSSGFTYEPSRDELQWSASKDIVYRNGKWAEILPSYPQIEINGYKGEFFDWGVKFGCQKYEKEFVIKLAECIKQNGFKMDYKANVIQIANYYLNEK